MKMTIGNEGKPLWSLIFTTRTVFISITNLKEDFTFEDCFSYDVQGKALLLLRMTMMVAMMRMMMIMVMMLMIRMTSVMVMMMV